MQGSSQSLSGFNLHRCAFHVSQLAPVLWELASRLQATDIYLALGISCGYQDEYWLLVIGVHVVPDYEAAIDYHAL
jgi:hypothetical protein